MSCLFIVLKFFLLIFYQILGSALKRNTVLKELWLAYNDLTCYDAYSIGLLLKSNLYIQFLDVSNNYIQVCQIINLTRQFKIKTSKRYIMKITINISAKYKTHSSLIRLQL